MAVDYQEIERLLACLFTYVA